MEASCGALIGGPTQVRQPEVKSGARIQKDQLSACREALEETEIQVVVRQKRLSKELLKKKKLFVSIV